MLISKYILICERNGVVAINLQVSINKIMNIKYFYNSALSECRFLSDDYSERLIATEKSKVGEGGVYIFVNQFFFL